MGGVDPSPQVLPSLHSTMESDLLNQINERMRRKEKNELKSSETDAIFRILLPSVGSGFRLLNIAFYHRLSQYQKDWRQPLTHYHFSTCRSDGLKIQLDEKENDFLLGGPGVGLPPGFSKVGQVRLPCAGICLVLSCFSKSMQATVKMVAHLSSLLNTNTNSPSKSTVMYRPQAVSIFGGNQVREVVCWFHLPPFVRRGIFPDLTIRFPMDEEHLTSFIRMIAHLRPYALTLDNCQTMSKENTCLLKKVLQGTITQSVCLRGSLGWMPALGEHRVRLSMEQETPSVILETIQKHSNVHWVCDLPREKTPDLLQEEILAQADVNRSKYLSSLLCPRPLQTRRALLVHVLHRSSPSTIFQCLLHHLDAVVD